jgi:hypothetical protein
MRVSIKFGFAAAAILVSTLGYVSLTQAAPLADVADTVIAMQKAQMPNEMDGLIQKAHDEGMSDSCLSGSLPIT